VGDESPREIAVRVVVALIEMAERRSRTIPNLTAAVEAAVGELDPDHLRDTSPTWFQDLPPWHQIDSFDRLRRAHDQLLVLEIQAGEIIYDLRGVFRLAAVGSAARPHGYTPARAHAELMRMALRRGEMLADLGKAERVLRPRLSGGTSRRLRAVLRAVIGQELAAREEQVRLTELLTPPTDLRQSV
jgi:hypothetical protein